VTAVSDAAPPRQCPECLGLFTAAQANQLFCCVPHKKAWNNRAYSRGGVLAPLMMAARQTRFGTRGSEAERAIGRRALQQRWKDEDAAAGRMTALAYVQLRYGMGLVDVTR
jgi:hypothetical protein